MFVCFLANVHFQIYNLTVLEVEMTCILTKYLTKSRHEFFLMFVITIYNLFIYSLEIIYWLFKEKNIILYLISCIFIEVELPNSKVAMLY